MKTLFAITLAALFCLSLPMSSKADCGDCGRIKKIEPYTTHRSSNGGMVAGAIVGGLVGNQLGGGDGKKLTTVAGAVGGAYAGKKIAENSEKTMYRVTVKMEDGHYETVKQSSMKGLVVGNSVRIRNGKVVRL